MICILNDELRWRPTRKYGYLYASLIFKDTKDNMLNINWKSLKFQSLFFFRSFDQSLITNWLPFLSIMN